MIARHFVATGGDHMPLNLVESLSWKAGDSSRWSAMVSLEEEVPTGACAPPWMGDMKQELPVPPKTLWAHLWQEANVKK